jgi:hypothetical protein
MSSPIERTLFAPLILVGLIAGAAMGQVPVHTFQGDATLHEFARAVGGAGDVNGDGWDDVVVGIPDTDDPLATGSAVIYSGRDGSVIREVFGVDPGDGFGTAVDGLGDLDGDGKSEILVGSLVDYVHVISGIDGSVMEAHRLPPGSDAGFGAVLAGLGDVDGDDVPDYIVGAPKWENWSGGYAVYTGAKCELLRVRIGVSPGDQMAVSVGDAGDVDDDGLDDYIVGSIAATMSIGSAAVYSGPTGDFLMGFGGGSADSLFGAAVGTAGDVDGDGHDDPLVGAPQWFTGPGWARLFSGDTGEPIETFHGTVFPEEYGWNVGGLGDVDGDGVDDFFVAAHGAFTFPASGHGRIDVYSGATLTVLRSFSGQQEWYLGAGAAAAGDVNGDGRTDLIVGSAEDIILTDTGLDGIAYVFTLCPPFDWLGEGLDGAGPAPLLWATGTLQPASAGSFVLDDALPSTTTALVVGLTQIAAPFKGGVMVPDNDLLLLGLPVDATGRHELPFVWPSSASGLTVYLQHWVTDAGGPSGYSASNALQASAP